ncbi:MAG: hypothetical protein SFX74_01985 [Fimbriimonadaceae bacterium]|nr:hypothetical protein [Fimbriimonadaceae bacterium]
MTIGIIVLIAGIALSLVQPVKEQIAITVTKSNLRQLFIATELYRAAEPSHVDYGDSRAMGLPDQPYDSLNALKLLRPPRAETASDRRFGVSYFRYYLSPDRDGLIPKWKDYTLEYQSQAIMYSDPFNNTGNAPLDGAPFYRRRVIGITVDGYIRDRRRRGDWMERLWWHDQK